jgi:phage recombination protein Bet
MSNQEVATAEPRSVLRDMADRFGMEPANFEQTLRATVVPQGCTREQLAAFLLVAKNYNLNPITKEIFAFPRPGGGIQPVVSVDGWCNIINSHPQIGGIEFDDHLNEQGKVTAITCKIWRKDRDRPVNVTEYMAECVRDTDVWKRWPRRMLRHKALIQCARYSFGFAGIVDIDEAERETSAQRRERQHAANTTATRPDLAARMKTLAQIPPAQASSEPLDEPLPQDDDPEPASDAEIEAFNRAAARRIKEFADARREFDNPEDDPPDPNDADYQRGVSDARHGLKSCLNIEIRQDDARLERWRAGWHSVMDSEPPPQIHDTLEEKSDHGRLKG